LHRQHIGVRLGDHPLHAGIKTLQHSEEHERDCDLNECQPGAPWLAPQPVPHQREVFHAVLVAAAHACNKNILFTL
jgi:hypothetical protein